MLADGGSLEAKRFFLGTTVEQMTTLASGLDSVFGIATAFFRRVCERTRLTQVDESPARQRLPLAILVQAVATRLLIRKIIWLLPMS